MKKKILIGLIFLVGFLLADFVFAQDVQTIDTLQRQIKQLQEQIAMLQSKLTELQAKPQETFILTRTLSRGMSGSDIAQLQEFLKQLPDIYPERLVTGYFGSLTEAAVKKFQEKYGIESIGIVGPKTRQKLNELVTVAPTTPESTNKPKICYDGGLRDNCKQCECGIGYECQQDGSCSKRSSCGNKICEADETSGSCSADCAISLSDCISILKNGDSSDKLDLVFFSDGFTASELAHFVTDVVPTYSGIREGSKGILSFEPYKSAKEKFNIWAVPAVESLNCSPQYICHDNVNVETHSKIMAALSRCPFSFDQVVIVMHGRYSFIRGIIGGSFSYIDYGPGDSWFDYKDRASMRLTHEFSHTFAGLEDEYSKPSYIYDSASEDSRQVLGDKWTCDTTGCPKWCSGAPRYSYQEYAPECFGLNETDCKNKDNCAWVLDYLIEGSRLNPYYSGTFCISKRSEKDNGVGCMSETGCYQGCGPSNWWRSANQSIMSSNYDDDYGFSGYHQKIISKALSKYK